MTSSSEALETLRWGGRRTAPYAFTEQGVAMLSSILSSPQAVQVNIAIMRAFVKLRELAMTHHDLAKQLNALEEKTEALSMQHDTFARNTRAQLKQVFDAIRELMTPPEPQKKRPIERLTGMREFVYLQKQIEADPFGFFVKKQFEPDPFSLFLCGRI